MAETYIGSLQLPRIPDDYRVGMNIDGWRILKAHLYSSSMPKVRCELWSAFEVAIQPSANKQGNDRRGIPGKDRPLHRFDA